MWFLIVASEDAQQFEKKKTKKKTKKKNTKLLENTKENLALIIITVDWFKQGSCQFLAKECAQYWLTA